MYNLLLIYTTDGFKDHVNLPIPAEEQGAEGTESENNTMLWENGKKGRIFKNREPGDTEIISYVFLPCVFKVKRGN